MKSFGCMPAVRTPEASRTLTMPHPGILPSPLRDKVGVFDHDRFRGYVSVHFRSGLHPPCLRFAAPVAGHHARLGTRLLVRLCRGRHFRQLNFMRLQGATLIGRVEDWRAGLGRCLCSLLSRSFGCECHSISTMPRFQPPPRRTQHADFPHYALLFASPQGLWDLSCRNDFQPWPANPVAVE